MKIKRKIHLFGVPRSGGTLIWHVFREIFKNSDGTDLNPQTHDWKELKTHIPIVIVFRDPRAITFSHWRIFHAEHDEKGNFKRKKKGPTSEIKSVKKRLTALYAYMAMDNPKLVLRYESFFGNYDYLFDEIEKFFNIKIGSEKKEKIVKITNVKRNKKIGLKRAKENEKFEHYDPKDHIHSNHIATPGVDEWRKHVTKEELQKLNKEFRPELTLMGYND